MKPLLLSLYLALFVQIYTYSQNAYYYHEGAKVNLSADSSRLVIKAVGKTKSQIAGSFKVATSDVIEYAGGVFAINEKTVGFARQNGLILSEYEYAGPVFTLGRDTSILLPSLIIKVKQGINY